jgi:hypothetical protein
MQTTAQRPRMYWRGDEAEYTGKTRVLYGAVFYVWRWIEGHRAGETFLTQTAPKW